MAKLLDTLTKPFRDAANKIVDTVKEELNIKYEPEDESLTANVKGLIKQATTNVKKNIKKKAEEYEKTHQEDVINPEPAPEPEPKPEPIINPESIPTVEPETNKDTTTRTLFAFDSNDPDVIKDNDAFHTELELKKVEDTKAFLNNIQPWDIVDLPQADGTTEQIVYDPKEEITSRWYKFWEDDSGYQWMFQDLNTNKKDDSLYTQFLTDVAHTKDGKMTKEELSKKYESVFDRVAMDYKDYIKKYPETPIGEEQYKAFQNDVYDKVKNKDIKVRWLGRENMETVYTTFKIDPTLDAVLKAYDEWKLDYDYKNRDLDKHARRAIHSQEELINLYSNTDTETIQNVYSVVQQKSPAKDEQKMVEDTMNIFQTVASNLNFAQSMEYYNQYVGIQKLLNLKWDAKKYEHLTTFFTNKVNDVFSFGTDIYYNPAALQDHSMDKYQHLWSVSTQEILNLAKNPNLTKEEKKVVEKVINRLYEAELIEDYETLGNVIDYTNAFIKDDENRLQASYTYLWERLKDIWDWSSAGWWQGVAMIQGDQDLDPISAWLKNSLSNISVEARSVKGKYDNKLFDSLTGEEDKSVGNYHVKYANDSRRAKADMVTMFWREILTDPLTLVTLPMSGGVSVGAKFFSRASKVTRLDKVMSKLNKVIVGIDKTSKSMKLVDNFVANSGKTWLLGMTKWALDEVGLDIIMANAQKTEYNNTDLSIDIATGIFSAIIKTREIRSFLNWRKTWGVDDSLIRMYLASKWKKDDEIETIMQSMSVDNKTKLWEEIRKDLLALGDKLPKWELNQNVFEEMLLNLDKSSGGSTAKNLSNTLNEKVYKNIEQETQRLLNNAEYNAKELLANNGSKLVSFVKNENGWEDLVWNPNIKNSRQKGLNQYTSWNLNFSLSRSQITKNRISRWSKVANDLVVDLFGKEYKKLGILEKMLFNKKINKEFSSKKEVMQKILNDGRLEFFTYLHLTKQDVRKMTASKLKKAYTQFVNDSDPVKTKPQQTKEGNVTPASTKAEQILGLLTGDKEKFWNKHLPRDVFYALQACLKEMSPSETLRFLNSLEKTNTLTDLVSGMVAVSAKDLPSVWLRRLLRDKRYATIDKMPYTIKRVDRNTIKLVPTETKDKSKILYLDLSGKYALLKDADGKILEQEVVLKLYKKRTKTDDFTLHDDEIADFLKLFWVDASPELIEKLIKEYGNSSGNINALKVLDGAGVFNTLKKNNFGNWLIEFVLKDKINELKQDRYELHSFVKELTEEFNSINAFEKKFPTNGLSFVELHDVYLDALWHKKVWKEVFDALHLDDKSIIDRMAAVVYSNDGIKLNTSAKTTKAIATARQKRILEVLYGKQQAKNILASEVGFLYIENIKKAQKALGLSDDELVYEIQKWNWGFIQDIVNQFSHLNLSVEEKLFKDFAHFNDLLSQITNRIPKDSEWKTAPEDKQHFLKWLDDIEDANNMKQKPNDELNDLIKEARDFYKSFDFEEFEDRLMQELFRSNYNKIYHFSDDSENIYTQSLIEQKVWWEGWVGVMQYMNDYFQKHIAAKTIYVWNDGNIEVLRWEPLQAEIDAVKESIQEKIKKGINFGWYYDPASKSIVYNAWQATYVDVNHEWFHSSIALCFSDAEREEIHKLFLDVFDKHKKEIMNNATQRWYLGGLAWMSETEIKLFLTEEWLAERYWEWATGKMINKVSLKERKEMWLPDGYGWENILWSKVINFFKRLWTRMQLLFHPEVRNKVMDLFEKVYNRTDIVKKDIGQTLPEWIRPTTLDKFSLHPKDKIKLDWLVSDEWYTDSNWKKYVLLDGKIFSATDWNVDPNNIIRSDSVSISGRSYAPNDLEQYRTVKLSNKQETNYHDLLESMIGENIEWPSKRIYNQLKNNIWTDPNTASQSFFVDIPIWKDREKRLTFSLSNNDPKYLDYEVSYNRPKSKWVSDTMRFHVFIKKKYNNTWGVNVTDATLTSVANMATLSYFMKEKNIFLNYSDQIALLAEARYKSLFYPIDNPYKAKLLQWSNYDNNLEAINGIETLNRFNLLIPDGWEWVYATLTQWFKEYRDKKIIEVLRKSNIPFKYYLNPNGTVNIEFQLTDKNWVVSTVGFHIQSKNLTSDQIKRLLWRWTQNAYPMQTQYTKHLFWTMLTDSELNRKNLENIVNFDKNVSDTIKQTWSNPDGIVKMSLSRLPENTEEKKFLIDYYTSIVNDKSKTWTDKELMEDLTLYKTKDNTYILRSVWAPFSIVKFLELDELKALACNWISVNSRYTISDTKYFWDEFEEDEVWLVFSTRNNKDLFNRMTVTYWSVRTYNMQETLIWILAYDVWNKFYKQTWYDISCLWRIDPKDADKIRKRVYPYIADILEKYWIYLEFMGPDLLNDFIKVYNWELIKPNKSLCYFNINRYIYDLWKDVDGKRDNSVVIEYINKFYSNRNPELNLDNDMSIEKALKASKWLPFQKGTIIPSQRNALELINKIFWKDMSDWANHVKGTLRRPLELPLSDMKDLDKIKDSLISHADSHGWDFEDFKNLSDLKQKEVLYILLGVWDYNDLQPLWWTSYTDIHDVRFITTWKDPEHLKNELESFNKNKDIHYVAVPKDINEEKLQLYIDEADKRSDHYIFIVNSEYASQTLPYVKYSRSRIQSNKLIDDIGTTDFETVDVLDPSTSLEEKAMSLKAISWIKKMVRSDANSTVENILKDFEPTVQKYEAMDYNTYYIPTSTNWKPVRIYEMINSAKQYPKSITFVDYDDNLVYRIKELVDQWKTDIWIRLPKIENEKLFYDKWVDKEYKSYDWDDEFTNQLLEKIKSDCDVYEWKDGSILVKEKWNPIFIAKGTNSEMLDEILRSWDEWGITFSFWISDKYPETLDAYWGITIFLTNKDDSMFKDFYYFYWDWWTIEPRQVAALQLLEHDKKAAKEMYGDNYKEAYKIIKDQSLLQDRRYVDDFFDSKIATKKNLNVIKKEHPEWFTKKEIEKIYNKYWLTVWRRVHIPWFKLSASGKEKYYFIGDTLDKRTTNKYNKLVESMPIKLSLYADTTGLIDVVKIIEDINNWKFDEAMGKNKQYDEFKKLDNWEQQAIMAYILNKHFGQKLAIEGNMIEWRRARMESKYLKWMVINSDSELDSTIQAIKNNGYKYDLIDQWTLSNTVKLQDRLNKADDKTLFVIDNSNGAVRNLDNLWEVMFSRSRTLSDEERIDVLDSIVHRNGFKDTSISYLNRVKQLNKASKDLWVTKGIKDTSSIKTKNSNRRWPSKQIAFIKEADAALQWRREVVNQIKEQEKNIRNIRNSAPYKLLERISELTKTNPSIIKELKRPAKNIPVLDTKAKNIDINNNSFWDVAPVWYLDKKYWDISSMQQWLPQEEIELNKTYWKFEIIPYTKESEWKIDFTAKDNFVLRSNDWYSFFKMKNQLDRLDANHVKVYERDWSNIAYYSRNRNNQEWKDTIKDWLDLFDEVSWFTSVCHI